MSPTEILTLRIALGVCLLMGLFGAYMRRVTHGWLGYDPYGYIVAFFSWFAFGAFVQFVLGTAWFVLVGVL